MLLASFFSLLIVACLGCLAVLSYIFQPPRPHVCQSLALHPRRRPPSGYLVQGPDKSFRANRSILRLYASGQLRYPYNVAKVSPWCWLYDGLVAESADSAADRIALSTHTRSLRLKTRPINSSACCFRTYLLLMRNGLAGGCADCPGGLTSLCVEGSCKPYIVQQDDTCPGISAANNITLIQLLSWNPNIDPKCVNLYQEIGHVICLSSPAGHTAPSVSDVGSAPTPATTPAPVPSYARAGSNVDCGAWLPCTAKRPVCFVGYQEWYHAQ